MEGGVWGPPITPQAAPKAPGGSREHPDFLAPRGLLCSDSPALRLVQGRGGVSGVSPNAVLAAPLPCVRRQRQRSKQGQEGPAADLEAASHMPHRMLLALKAHPGLRPEGSVGSAALGPGAAWALLTRLSAVTERGRQRGLGGGRGGAAGTLAGETRQRMKSISHFISQAGASGGRPETGLRPQPPSSLRRQERPFLPETLLLEGAGFFFSTQPPRSIHARSWNPFYSVRGPS